jgi:hypothetical protein
VDGTLASIATYAKFSTNPFSDEVVRWLEKVPADNTKYTGSKPVGNIKYIGSKSGMRYIAPKDPQSTINFYENQMDLEISSTFSYLLMNGTRFATSAKQLQEAIERHDLTEVSVHAPRLASTDHRVTSNRFHTG